MTTLLPAYLIAYVDSEHPPRLMPIEFRQVDADVWIQSYSLDGRAHYGAVKPMKYENLPLFLFQLADAGYSIEPARQHDYPGIKQFFAFSPAFVEEARRTAQQQAT